MRHGAFVATIALLLGSTSAMAVVPLQPVQILRHGAAVTRLRNMHRIALFGAADPGALREAVARHGLRLDNAVRANDVTVLELVMDDGTAPGAPELDAAADELLAIPGVMGYGPVFDGAANATVPTGRIWVYLPRGTGQEAARKRVEAMGLALDDYLDAAHGIAMVRPTTRFSLARVVQQLVAAGFDAEPELMRRLVPRNIPADTYFARQWYLRNTGDDIDAAFGGGKVPATAYADCRASDAWDITTGSADVIVGVIDSGTDCTHPELQGKCVSPYNAISDTLDATPPTLAEDTMAGHGTSVAGIVAAPADAAGMVGVCPSCRIVPVRLIQSGVYLTDAMMLRAFKHAVDAGAAVINNSWGPAAANGVYIPVSSGELEGQQYAATGRNGLGTLVVYAAGNEDQNTTYQGQFKTGLPNVMAVAASNQFDTRSVYSDFGAEVDLAAPSNDDYLTPSYVSLEVVGRGDLDQNYTSTFGGTSAAAPVVSGTAALVVSANGSLTAQQVRDILRSSADKVDPDGGAYDTQGHSLKYGYGRVNAYKAVLAATGATDPACSPPAATEDCSTHLDENCDGRVDEGCSSPTHIGTPCTATADCGTEAYWECPSSGKVRGLCTWDCSQMPCPSGATCVQGRCALDCSDAAPCAFAPQTICTDSALGTCLPRCSSTADCNAGEICDAQTHLCHLNTDGLPGSTCTSDECVGDQPMCLTPNLGYPGGYCTHACTNHLQCENHGRCVETSMGSFCYAGCSFDGDCRPGYLCEQAGPRAGSCYKICDKDSQCNGSQPGLENIVCDLASGRCVDSNAADGGADAQADADPDAQSAADAGADAGQQEDGAADAAQGSPSSTGPAAASADNGCGCRTVQTHRSQGAGLLLSLASAAVVARRRRRAPAPRS